MAPQALRFAGLAAAVGTTGWLLYDNASAIKGFVNRCLDTFKNAPAEEIPDAPEHTEKYRVDAPVNLTPAQDSQVPKPTHDADKLDNRHEGLGDAFKNLLYLAELIDRHESARELKPEPETSIDSTTIEVAEEEQGDGDLSLFHLMEAINHPEFAPKQTSVFEKVTGIVAVEVIDAEDDDDDVSVLDLAEVANHHESTSEQESEPEEDTDSMVDGDHEAEDDESLEDDAAEVDAESVEDSGNSWKTASTPISSEEHKDVEVNVARSKFSHVIVVGGSGNWDRADDVEAIAGSLHLGHGDINGSTLSSLVKESEIITGASWKSPVHGGIALDSNYEEKGYLAIGITNIEDSFEDNKPYGGVSLQLSLPHYETSTRYRLEEGNLQTYTIASQVKCPYESNEQIIAQSRVQSLSAELLAPAYSDASGNASFCGGFPDPEDRIDIMFMLVRKLNTMLQVRDVIDIFSRPSYNRNRIGTNVGLDTYIELYLGATKGITMKELRETQDSKSRSCGYYVPQLTEAEEYMLNQGCGDYYGPGNWQDTLVFEDLNEQDAQDEQPDNFEKVVVHLVHRDDWETNDARHVNWIMYETHRTIIKDRPFDLVNDSDYGVQEYRKEPSAPPTEFPIRRTAGVYTQELEYVEAFIDAALKIMDAECNPQQRQLERQIHQELGVQGELKGLRQLQILEAYGPPRVHEAQQHINAEMANRPHYGNQTTVQFHNAAINYARESHHQQMAAQALQKQQEARIQEEQKRQLQNQVREEHERRQRALEAQHRLDVGMARQNHMQYRKADDDRHARESQQQVMQQQQQQYHHASQQYPVQKQQRGQYYIAPQQRPVPGRYQQMQHPMHYNVHAHKQQDQQIRFQGQHQQGFGHASAPWTQVYQQQQQGYGQANAQRNPGHQQQQSTYLSVPHQDDPDRRDSHHSRKQSKEEPIFELPQFLDEELGLDDYD